MSRPPIMWSRLFIEGVVIVVSILLAFAIDAWWDERQEAEEAELQVERVVADQNRSEKRSIELREMRPAMNAYTARLIPALDVVLGHPVMADYSPSRFPYDPTVLFSDMYFESLIADFAIRMELNRGGHRELLEAHRTLIQKINAARKP